MIGKKLNEIEIKDLQTLIDNQVLEGKTIEYKVALPPQTKGGDEKRELLADISSFANTDGGDLIIGIDSKEGLPTNVVGLDVQNIDDTKLQILNLVRDGISPRVDVDIHPLKVTDSKTVLVLRVKTSLDQPHCVTFAGVHRFYRRNSAGKYLMDVTEIRAAFLRSADLVDRLKSFRRDRVYAIKTGDTPCSFANLQTWLSLHVVPLTAMSSDFKISGSDLKHLQDGGETLFQPLWAHGYSHRINLDGVVAYVRDDAGVSDSYVQLYRSGILEAVCAGLLDHSGVKRIATVAVEQEVMAGVTRYLALLKQLGFSAPILVYFSLVGIEGYSLATSRSFRKLDPIRQADLLFPEVVFEDFSQDVPQTMRPLFDMMWNAGGIFKSYNFDKDGKYTG